uniref:Glyco_hydro_2_C domain-containing protein n=1 Tax=Caenorhabditis japonica TaxID=281687 RepID=A0A8R1DT88_CAEJA
MGEPNLYTLEVALIGDGDELKDIYREVFGFRTVTISDSQIFINNKPFYCLGFGMHEDFELIGRGFNQAVMTKDLNLLEWMGGNCYRTTHYPYSEERMFENDRRGIAVIVETPAVGLKGFPKANNNLHVKMLTDMIDRDKNHPSVIAWSLANEPVTSRKESRNYFKTLVDTAHGIDKTRPVTTVYGPTNFDNDQTADLMDFICVNRYYGWYIDMGYVPWINQSVYWDISLWRETFKKPIMVTEYGADSIPGMNQQPSVDFSEQYQDDVIRQTHFAFDALRKEHAIAGEMIWNFADFMTGMSEF